MRLAAAKPCSFFRISRAGVAVVAAAAAVRRPWRAAAASGNAEAERDDGGDELVSPTRAGSRRARLSARRRERIRLLDVVEDGAAGAVGGIGEFLRQPAGVESLLNTRALQSFAAVEPEPNTFRCTLRTIGFLGFQVAPVLDLRVTPTCTDCTVEMLSCRFEGSGSVEQQNELFSAFMSNHITWKDDGEEPCLDIDVNLEVTLEVFITGVHKAIHHASIVSSGETRQPVDARPPGQASTLTGGAAAERLPFVGSASAAAAAAAAWNILIRNCSNQHLIGPDGSIKIQGFWRGKEF
ncbi:uncharacterized protein LOC102719139 isoform X1 [Oryza brachyantha]|uniref:uncharacterized protein LOC102719139 isoform X1 n=1 Tax=Oryza brachyantha TaxID=4533 RepID=UPI001ADD5C1F|nr:uncharacterized protein LOC102719139 isoform X1 [Oryza brachyantha]